MKRYASAFAILVLLFAAGCRGQVPPTPPQYACPSAGNAAYTPLNQSTATTALTYKDTTPGVGNWCYVAQGELPAAGGVPVQYSGWSNTTSASPTSTQSVNLSWGCQSGTGTTCTGVLWIISRTVAVTATAPAVPVMSAPTTASVVQPALGAQESAQLAYFPKASGAQMLTARVVK